MVRIYYIYRKKQSAYFSIEKVFAQISAFLKDKVTIGQFYVPYARLSPGNIIKNLRAVRKVQADLYHVTGDIHYAVLGLPGRKTILTIHDCSFLYNTGALKRRILKFFFLDWPVRHCRMITTISEKSKAEIIRYSNCSPDKVVVVPNPVGDGFHYSDKEFNNDKPVLLFIGSTANKNLERVIQAIEGMSCHLTIVGITTDTQNKLLEAANISVNQASGLSDQELAYVYTQCDIVVFPSTYEGFGLPIVEGQKSGRPVITSNISPMKEVAGEGACLVDPMDVTSIKTGIMKVIHDSGYRKHIINKGSENVRRYEPVFIAEQYLQVYKDVVEKG